MKNILLLILFAFEVSVAIAQSKTESIADWNSSIYQIGKRYPGYVINLSGDTIEGYIEANTRCNYPTGLYSNQNLVEFYLKETDKKAAFKYKPADLKGYKIADKEYESLLYSGGLMKKPNFNLIVKEGKIRQYEWYTTVENFMSMRAMSGESEKDFDIRRFDTKIIFAKDPAEPVEQSSLSLQFLKKMPLLVSDNVEISTKISAKEKNYRFFNVVSIIEEYNVWSASK